MPLRFDGLYRGPVSKTSSCDYFRFYEDNLVVTVAVVAEEEPESVARWFHRDTDDVGRGYWSLDGDRISFHDVSSVPDDLEETYETLEIAWNGRLDGDALIMDSQGPHHSATNERFEFIQDAAPAPKSKAPAAAKTKAKTKKSKAKATAKSKR